MFVPESSQAMESVMDIGPIVLGTTAVIRPVYIYFCSCRSVCVGDISPAEYAR